MRLQNLETSRVTMIVNIVAAMTHQHTIEFDPKSILPNEHGPSRNPDAKKSKLTDKKGQGAKPKEIITRSKSSRSTSGSNSSSVTPGKGE